METTDRILALLQNGTVSGEDMAAALGISRAAVAKHIKKLQAAGFDVRAAAGVGYRLMRADVPHPVLVQSRLSAPWEICVKKQTTSTNTDAKLLAVAGKTRCAVLASAQTAGRGRLGRSFFSPDGAGLYLSAVLRPTVDNVQRLTMYAAVATARAVESLTNAKIDIKWVNDLYADGKKLCGILCEGGIGLEGGVLEYAVVGIGVNLKKVPLPKELQGVVTSLEEVCGTVPDRNALAAEILNRLLPLEESALPDFMDEYIARNIVPGRRVRVNDEYTATALRILPSGALVVQDDGGRQRELQAGEVHLAL